MTTLSLAAGPPRDADLANLVNLIRLGKASTRAELTQQSGLGRNIVSSHLRSAVDLGLVVQNGYAPSSGGRSPNAWRFAHEAGNVLTASIGTRDSRLALTDLAGTVIESISYAWPINNGPSETLDQTCKQLDVLAHLATEPVWGIGIALPGPIDHISGRPVSPPIMAGWHDFDVRNYVEERLHFPVLVDNDVNAMALGHHRGCDMSDSIYVYIGTGIGAGLLSHGDLHRGAQGAAGDIGHARINGYETVVCRCGRIGCLEATAGGWALERTALRVATTGLSQYVSSVKENTGHITVDDIVAGV